MLILHRLLFLLMFINIHIEAQWNVSLRESPPLPRGLHSQAVGVHNDRIHLIGGPDTYAKSWIEYIISSNTFIDKGIDAAGYSSSGHSQHYTQIGDKLYWIEGSKTIYSYDFIWQSFTTETHASYLTNDYACLTSYKELLFVLGGYYNMPQRIFQVFNTTSLSWITPVNDMINVRRDHACATDTKRGVIYAIGGFKGTKWSTNVETLVIGDNITQSQWQTSNSLSYGDWGFRAVYVEYADSIFVINHDLSRIDCETGQVSMMTNLHYTTQNGGVIFVDSVLYIFGGYDSITTWQVITNPLILGSPSNDESTTITTTSAEENRSTDNMESDKDDRRAEDKNSNILFIVIGVGALLITLCIIGYCVYRSKQTKSTKETRTLQMSVEGSKRADGTVAITSASEDNEEGQNEDVVIDLTTAAIVIEEDAVVASEQNDEEKEEKEEKEDGHIASASSGAVPGATNTFVEHDEKNEDIAMDHDTESDSATADSLYVPHDQLMAKETEGNQSQPTATSNDEGEGDVVNDLNFKQWDSDHILKWILSINNGILKEYEVALRKEIFARNVNGNDIVSFDIDDIKSLGVIKFAHAKLLQIEIVQLIKESHIQIEKDTEFMDI